MIDSLIAGLSKELELSAEEIADTIWLALQIQESPSELTATEKFKSSQRPPKRELEREALPEAPTKTSDSEDTGSEPPPDEPKAGIYPRRQNEILNSGLSFKVPDAPSLREPLTLARALKPLMRRIPSGMTFEFDEAATTQRIADEGLWLPVLKPTLEPWFVLELVVDESLSMQIWRSTIREWERLLKNYGIFRDVRVWGLIADENEQLQIRRGIGTAAKAGYPRSPAELIDSSGRRLVLVVSDCVSSLWRNGKVTATLDLWAKQGSMAIVQMLPQWLWKRTALGRAVEVQLQGVNPGDFNQKLIAREVSLWDDLEEVRGVKVPVLTLEPDRVASWAQMLSGKGSIWTSGYAFKLDATPASRGRELFGLDWDRLSAEQRVQAFRVTASPMARKLAGLLAAAPVISLPIVRLIQETLLKESQQVHVAEVFLGGLLKPLFEINPETNPNYVQYEFMDGVRELFIESVPEGYVLDVVEEVSKYVARKVGLSLEDFAAVLRNPQQVGDREIAGDIRYFATVTARVLRCLGGEYARFAEELESYNRPELRKNVTADSDGLFDLDYQIGGSLPPDSRSYIKRQADDELYHAVKRGRLCIVSAPRQMGKSSLKYQVMKQLRQENFACASIDLSGIGIREITPKRWYLGLINSIANAFNLINRFDWIKWLNEREEFSPVILFREFIKKVLLKEISEFIVLFFDEFDMTLYLDFREDFFSLLRGLSEMKAEEDNYNRLTFVLSGVFLDSDLSQNTIVSPLTNIAFQINLEGFSYEEALPLAGGLAGKTNNPQALLREILEWTGGQPFLTQKLCLLVKKTKNNVPEGSEKTWLENLVRTKIIERWREQDKPEHLRTIEDTVLSKKTSRLLTLYKSIVQGNEHFDRDSKAIQKLMLAGLVIRRDSQLKVANKIYSEIFDREWVERNITQLTNIKSNSNQEIDYTQLRNLLAEGKWEEADRETFRIMLKFTDREKNGTLDYQAIENASCIDLNTIDKLWIEASKGRFGFSIQLKKWKEAGGRSDGETEYKLGYDIGWYVNNKWLSDISGFTFDLSAPMGHLPVEWTFHLGGIFPRREEAILFSDLANRLLTCKINNLEEYIAKHKWNQIVREAIQNEDESYELYSDLWVRYSDRESSTNVKNMNFFDELNTIIDRIASDRFTEADIATLRRLLGSGDRQIATQLGKYNVNISEGKEIHIGDRIYVEWNDEAIQKLQEVIQEQSDSIPLLPQKLPQEEYTRLKNLLAAGRWREANEITRTIILKAGKGEKEGWLSDEQIQNFPNPVLKVIDRLWVQSSNGRFGFGVQKRIFNECEQNPQIFGDRVGWYVGDTWISASQVIYSPANAPEGHLPWGVMPVITMDNAALDAFVNGVRTFAKTTIRQGWQKQFLADFMAVGGLLTGDKVDKEEFKRSLEYELSHDEAWWEGKRLEELKVRKLFSLFAACPNL